MTILESLYKQKKKLVFENNYFFGYWDDMPITRGHCIILPKREVKSIFDLKKKEIPSLYLCIEKVNDVIKKKFHPDGINIVINEGSAAGKVMDILVVHVIPRYFGDSVSPVASGARTVLGMYSCPAWPEEKSVKLNDKLSEKELKNMYYQDKDPDKHFYIGLKVLIKNCEGKILVLTRNDPKFKGTIDIPGGRCEHRDTEELKAVQRELYEELGVYIDEIKFFDHFIFWDILFVNKISKPVGLIILLFTATISNNIKIKLKKPEKITGYKWLTPEEIADNLTQYPLNIREKIKNMKRK